MMLVNVVSERSENFTEDVKVVRTLRGIRQQAEDFTEMLADRLFAGRFERGDRMDITR